MNKSSLNLIKRDVGKEIINILFGAVFLVKYHPDVMDDYVVA